jgi:anti-sigma B factor antagonist
VILDLSGVTFVDSTGLGLIVAAYRHSLNNGHPFSVAALTPLIARRFKITGLDRVIPIRAALDRE